MGNINYLPDALEAHARSTTPAKDEPVIKNENSNLESLRPRCVAHRILEMMRRRGGRGDDGCGVGMFIEAEEGSEGDEIYMPMPDMVWHW